MRDIDGKPGDVRTWQCLLMLIWTAWVSALSPASAQPAASRGEAALWRAIEGGGHVVLMRHALAPGVGDPAGFRIDQCGTQRNLSATGIAQARRIGDRFRANGVSTLRVYSSRWCRSMDTARLLGLGTVTPLPALDSFFAGGDEAQQSAAVLALARRSRSGPSLVLVTHQVNITALTRAVPRSGEFLVLRVEDGVLQLLGRIVP